MISQETIEKYKKIKWKKLTRSDMGEYSLKEIQQDLDSIKRIFDDILLKDNLQSIPDSQSSQIESQCQNLFSQVDYIFSYSDKNQRNQYIQTIHDYKVDTLSTLLPILQILNYDSKNGEPESLENTTSKAQEMISQIKDNLGQSKQLLNEQQSKNIISVTGQFANFFNEQAKENKKEASYSLFWFLLSAICSIFFISSLFYSELPKEDIKNIMNVDIFGKIFISSMLFFIVSVFRKDYLSRKHQYSLNKHRQNVLNTHRQMLESIQKTQNESEKETSNAILLEMARSIFDPKDTGYTKPSNSNSSLGQIVGVTKILDKKN